MDKVIEELEKRVKEERLNVLETRYDGFTYTTAIENNKGVYFIYTTKSFRSYHEDCLRVVHMSEHIPFANVQPFNTDFIMPYLKAIFDTGICITNYHPYFPIDDLIELLKQ